MFTSTLNRALFSIATLSVAAGAACAVTGITSLGVLPGDVFSQANAVSADGSSVAGSSGQGLFDAMRAFRWTSNTGPANIGALPDSQQMISMSINGNGTAIAGDVLYADYDHAFLWTQSGGLQDLGILPGGHWGSIAFGVSSDGTAVAGSSDSANDYRAFRWTQSGGMQNLGTLEGGYYSFGFAISGDGAVVAGLSDVGGVEHAVRWTSSGELQDLHTGSPDDWSGVYASNFDGSKLAGYIGNSAVLWTDTQAQFLGFLEGGVFAGAYAVTGDGRMVGGFSDDGNQNPIAMIWTQSTGMINLKTHLTNLGVDMTGWNLQCVTGLSRDGTTLVGTGTFNGDDRGWVVTIPPICAADFNHDAEVDFFDYVDFVAAFSTSDTSSDFNRDGGIDFFDYLDFVQEFASGC